MSYLQRTATDVSPFAQVYNNTANWTYNNRPDTKSETWLTASGTNGYEFSGQGYVFGFMTAVTGSLGQLKIVSSSSPRYENGFFCSNSVTSRTSSDDEAIGYGSTTEHYRGNFYPNLWGSYGPSSRINVIRME